MERGLNTQPGIRGMGRLRHTVPDDHTTTHLDVDSLDCELTALLNSEVIYSNRSVAVFFCLS